MAVCVCFLFLFFKEMKEEQKILVTNRNTMNLCNLACLIIFMPGGGTVQEHLILWQVNQKTWLHVPFYNKVSIIHKKDLGPSSTKHGIWSSSRHCSFAIFIIIMFKTSENSRGPSWSLCWTPDADVRQPKQCWQGRSCRMCLIWKWSISSMIKVITFTLYCPLPC